MKGDGKGMPNTGEGVGVGSTILFTLIYPPVVLLGAALAVWLLWLRKGNTGFLSPSPGC